MVKLLAVGAAILASPVLAQPTVRTGPLLLDQQDGQSPAAAGDSDREIVVTARKREERIEDVPIAASAFSGDDLRAFGVQSGLDLTQFTPGVTAINNGSGLNNEFIIRGEGATRQNNAETGSGLYRDEMFIAGGNVGGRDFAPLDFFDAARIEVLRGPQGSYFGRNAVGGAVNVVSERPTDTLGGRVELRAGSQRTYGTEGVFNLPIGDRVAVRVGGFGERQDGGFYRSTITGEILDVERRWGLRGQIALRPVDGMTINLLAEYSDEDTPRPDVFEFVLPVDDAPYNGATPSGFFIDRFAKPINAPSRFTRKIETYRADLSFDLGPVVFKSITGYRQRVATSQADVDTFAVGAVQRQLDARTAGSETFKRLFQDVRFSSNGTGPVTWLVGAEYTKVDSVLPTTTTAIVPDTLPAGCTAAIACTLPVIQASARNAFRQLVSSTDDESYALYGAVTVDLGRLSLTAEARYTRDDKLFVSDEVRRLDNPATPVNEQLRTSFSRSRATTRLTPGASIAFKLSDAVNLYARVATAFRAGGFNNDPGEPNDGVSTIALPPTYEPELVTGYEVGAKGRIAGIGRYSISAFYADKGNTLVNYAVFVGCPATPLRPGCAPNTVRQVPALLTGGSSYQYGVEAELQGRIFSGPAGRLSYRASATWANGKYGSAIVYSNGNANPATSLVATDVAGNRLARLREWTLTGTLGYAVPVAAGFEIFANVQGRAELGGFEEARNVTRYEDAVLANATLGVGNDTTALSLRVKNVFNADFFTIAPGNQFFNTQATEPRTFLVTLSHRFGG